MSRVGSFTGPQSEFATPLSVRAPADNVITPGGQPLVEKPVTPTPPPTPPGPATPPPVGQRGWYVTNKDGAVVAQGTGTPQSWIYAQFPSPEFTVRFV